MMETDPGVFQIRRLNDYNAVIAQQIFRLFREVFELEEAGPPPSLSYLERLLANPHFVVYAAMKGDEVAGGLTAFELPMYHGEHSEMFIYDVAVRPQFQRQGVGSMLLAAMQDYCRENGIKHMFVPAHEDDAHGLDFYRAAAGQAEKVVHFNWHLHSAISE